MSVSVLVFRGGPRDGQEEPTKPGFPAPDACEHRDFAGRYVRAETIFDDRFRQARHYYDYEPPR